MYALETAGDLDALIEAIGDKPVVMLGEATHGTHEFYTWRTAISQRLIREKGFRFLAVEGDWPDCYRINRWVKGYEGAGNTAPEVLDAFDRWPTWMWANWEVAALAQWMREHNERVRVGEKIGFYGLDVYSLWDSMREIQHYLEKEDPEAATAVRKAISCFAPFEDQEHLYGQYSLTGHSCQDKVLQLLQTVRSGRVAGDGDPEVNFSTEQNALIAVNAEKYYRAMMRFDNESWNVRDRHMMETLHRLRTFHGGGKVIVWEHNTHIGDARATSMKRGGMVNIGQLAREQYGKEEVALVGFGSWSGTVVAGEEWGAPMNIMQLPPAREGSIEHYLHTTFGRNGYLLFSEGVEGPFYEPVPHRAVGVVYHPDRERQGNYVPSVMAERYDAFIHFDRTKALHPLHLEPYARQTPDTFPFGF
jgi:erythromycin esterase